MTWILRHLELYLTAVGLLVIGAAGLLALENRLEPWRIVGLTATGVGVIHGCLFWAVRRRQRHIREQTIGAVQRMLKDVVNNQLMVIQLATDANQRSPGRIAPTTVDRSIRIISSAVATLSSESLRSWAARYDERDEPFPAAPGDPQTERPSGTQRRSTFPGGDLASEDRAAGDDGS